MSNITIENISSDKYDILELKTNFDNDKIRNLFSNFRTLDLIELFNLKKDYEKLGYSPDEIEIHLYIMQYHLLICINDSFIICNYDKYKKKPQFILILF